VFFCLLARAFLRLSDKSAQKCLNINFAVAIYFKEAFLLERLSTEPQLACSLKTKNTMFATICASHGFNESLQRSFSLFMWEVLVTNIIPLKKGLPMQTQKAVVLFRFQALRCMPSVLRPYLLQALSLQVSFRAVHPPDQRN